MEYPSDNIFRQLVNAAEVEDMKEVSRLARDYLEARDAEERAAGFKHPAKDYLCGMNMD